MNWRLPAPDSAVFTVFSNQVSLSRIVVERQGNCARLEHVLLRIADTLVEHVLLRIADLPDVLVHLSLKRKLGTTQPPTNRPPAPAGPTRCTTDAAA